MTADREAPKIAAVRYVFLDRDGVINRKLPEGFYVTRWKDFEFLPGVAEAIASLNRAGAKVIVATNQRGIAQGLMTEAALEQIHSEMRAELARHGAAIDAIYYCPHGRSECDCRKPDTGMIEAAFRDFPGATPDTSVLIGDSLSDIECGRRAGMATIFVENAADNGNEHRKPGGDRAKELANSVAGSLAEAVRSIFG
jgi:D-glycero-D-manno-heptose 1,7-bisphosphate phosphatase